MPRFTFSCVILLISILMICPILSMATQLELYMADPQVRISQKIYCQIKDVVSTDKLQVTLDGTIIFVRNGNLRSEEIVRLDHRNQKAGSHNLVAKIVDQNGSEKAVVVKNWKTLHDGIPVVGIDENNAIRVNGELLFPIYVALNENDFEYWIDHGYINTGTKMFYQSDNNYTITTYTRWLDICSAMGARNIGPVTRWGGLGENVHGKGNNLEIMKAYVENLKNHKGVLGWQWSDEPNGGGTNNRAEPDEIRSWTDLCHQHDTDHPHFVNLGNAYHYGQDSNFAINLCKEYSYLYGAKYFNGEKKLLADIQGLDYYPIEYATKAPLQANFENMAKAFDRLREYNYDLCPILSWIENCDIHPDDDNNGFADGPPGSAYAWTPAPTPAEMWAEYWIKVIHGVKGFKVHPFFASDGTAKPPKNYEILAKFKNWIDDLKGAVLGADFSSNQIEHRELGGGRIDVMAKEFDGRVYLFTGNLKRQPEHVKFSFRGLRSGSKIQVYGENRTITSGDGYFEDSYNPLDVHIYILLAPPGNLRILQ